MKRVVRLHTADRGTLYLDLDCVESILATGKGTFVGVRGTGGYLVDEDAEALRAVWMDGHVAITVPGRESVCA
jgi:hypothetical protein